MMLMNAVQKHLDIFLSRLPSALVFPCTPFAFLSFLEKAEGPFLSEPGGVPAVM